MDTASKIGLVLVAGGLAAVAGEGSNLPGWILFFIGIILAFGPDLTARVQPRGSVGASFPGPWFGSTHRAHQAARPATDADSTAG